MFYDLSTLRDLIGEHRVVTVESCTGGLLAAALTSISGSSAFYHNGYITYANDAKIALGVSPDTLEKFGAVSAPTALEMAACVKNADFVIAVTGIAGPTGGTPEKPVGLVYIALNDEAREFHFEGDRDQVRMQTVAAALLWLEDAVRASQRTGV